MGMFGLITAAEHQRLSDERVVRLESSIASKDNTIEELCVERDRLKTKLGDEIRTNTRLALELSTAKKSNASDAVELATFRAARDRDNELRRQRREAQRAVKVATKDVIDNGILKTGKPTGKPRTAIPAKVRASASAKISGNRPAKKGAGK